MKSKKNKYHGIAQLLILACIFSFAFPAYADRTRQEKQHPARAREIRRAKISHEINTRYTRPASSSLLKKEDIVSVPLSVTPESERVLELKEGSDGEYELNNPPPFQVSAFSALANKHSENSSFPSAQKFQVDSNDLEREIKSTELSIEHEKRKLEQEKDSLQ